MRVVADVAGFVHTLGDQSVFGLLVEDSISENGRRDLRVGGSSNESSGGTDAADPRMWGGVAVAVLLVWAWLDHNAWFAALAPYGLTTEGTRTAGDRTNSQWGPVSENHYGTGDYHVNGLGWFTLAVVLAGAVAVACCAWSGMNVMRWRAGRGTGAIPTIPVVALAVVAAVTVFIVVFFLFGSDRRLSWHVLAAVVGMVLGAVAWFAVMFFTMMPADYWRITQGFAGRADQVLGHGHPSAGRVTAWQWEVGDEGQRWPAHLVAVTGPGWQHKPSELDELNRYAREFGWPPYSWRYDPMAKRITGTARPDTEFF